MVRGQCSSTKSSLRSITTGLACLELPPRKSSAGFAALLVEHGAVRLRVSELGFGPVPPAPGVTCSRRLSAALSDYTAPVRHTTPNQTLAATTILALVTTMLSATPTTASPLTFEGEDRAAVLLAERHYSQDGVEVDLYVTDGVEGQLTEATVTDRATGETVDMWTEGDAVYWHGWIDGALGLRNHNQRMPGPGNV